MPIIKSAIKRAKQALVRRSRNLQVKRAIKLDTQALHTAITEGKDKDIQTKLNEAYSEIDRAVKKGTLHKNTASRKKSQLAHAIAKASGTEVTPAETKTTKGAGKSAAKTTAKKTAAVKKTATATTAATKVKAATTKAATEKKAPAKKATKKTEE